MRRNHELRRLKPEGLWKSPLTEEQVLAALEFGKLMGARGDSAIHDVFLVEFNETLDATICISTAFEQIAVYAATQSRNREEIDSGVVDAIRRLPLFETHYALYIISPYEHISIMRYWPVGSRAEMQVIEQSQLPNGRYRLIAAFPYRDVDWTNVRPSFYRYNWSESTEPTEQFDILVRKFFLKKRTNLMLDLYLYH